MTHDQPTSWKDRLLGMLPWQHDHRAPASDTIEDMLVITAPAEQRRAEDWRDLVRSGRRVQVSWIAADGQANVVEMTARGEVRTIFEETVWVWLDHDLPAECCPALGQVVDVLVSTGDALRLVPCRLAETSHGASLQLAVTGRASRIQRRLDVRAQVSLPPMSAVRLSENDVPLGLVGVRLLDLSAGGACFQIPQSESTDRLRLMLRLNDDDPPLTPTIEILESGLVSRGRFLAMPENERRQIVQYVYRQELAERRETPGASTALVLH
jgi:hypothetical protein